jgi:amino acid adenylation domain-containing protein
VGTLHELLERTARRAPDRVALVEGGERVRYGALDARADRFARALAQAGVGRGDRVAIHLESCVEAVVAIFGALKAGAAFMPIGPTTKPARLAGLLADARPRAVVLPAAKLASLSEVLEGAPRVRLVATVGDGASQDATRALPVASFDELTRGGASSERCPVATIDLDLAALVYTSGSSGEPKGVMLSHLNVRTAIESIVSYLENDEHDVIFNALPLSFGYGLTQVFAAFAVGARVVLQRGAPFPHATLARIAEERATGLPLVPTLAAVLLLRDLAPFDLRSLRYVTNAGAALSVAQVRRIRAALPHARFFSMYGQTECLRIAYLDPEQVDLRPASVGRAIPNTEAWVVDDRGNPVGPETQGELVVRGAHVMKGYWRRPDETAKKLRDGALPGDKVMFTGDVFTTDRDGYLYFVGRSDDLIKCKGEKVSPREVEEVLSTLPGVAEVAVVGVPDEVLGEAVMAVVVRAKDAVVERSHVLRHAAERLEDHKVPTLVEFRAALPRTPNGKIAKRQLLGEESK